MILVSRLYLEQWSLKYGHAMCGHRGLSVEMLSGHCDDTDCKGLNNLTPGPTPHTSRLYRSSIQECVLTEENA